MAIDETVEDRHTGFSAHIDSRFDDVDRATYASSPAKSWLGELINDFSAAP